jgi:hypothetical protein
MRLIQRLINIQILFFFISTISFATNWYVKNGGGGSNNGTSWTNAWTSFGSINWGSINGGDYIFIDGGVDSVVYTSGMTIGKSGSAGNYIYIMPGRFSPSPSGHSGKVVMTPSSAGFTNSGGYDYIYIKGVTIRDFGGRGVYMWNGTSHIVIDSLTILNGGEMGTWWEESSYIEIKNCIVISKANNLNTDDNNYAQRVHHFYVHHNYFHMRNRQFGTGTDHLDNFQVADWGYAFYFYNNVCITDSAVQGHNIILGCKGNTANYSDTVLVFNNFFYDGGDPGCNYQRSVYFRYPESGGNVYQGYLVNNTIVTANWGAPVFEGEGGRVYVSNNIMVNRGVNGSTPGSCENGNWTWGQNGTSSAYYVRVDSCHTNLAWRSYNANPSFYGSGFVRTNGTHGTPSGWSDFVNNYGGTGVNADPKLAGNWRLGDYQLQASSPCIDAGTNMLYYLNRYVGYLPGFDPSKDIAGNPRNDGHWDIGAFEFTNGGGGNNPPNSPSNPNPVNGSINQPVNLTLTWSCTDPDGDPLTYDVYFGTNNNPPIVSSNQSNTNYSPGQLNNNTTYYWKIVARDNQGATTIGLIWNFTTIYASNYYVDKNANGNNNGTSWANAWQSFSAINWNSIQPGDIIYVSGGSDSTVYYERLVIGKSGTASNYITIRNSYAAGHNGKVIIEDPNTNTFDGCIYLSNRDWVYIKGIETRKGIRACYLYTMCDYVTIDSCSFRNWYPNTSSGGIKIEGNDNFPDALNCTNITIKNCMIESLPLYDLNSTDCLYAQGVLKLRINNNYIHQRNQSTNNMHVDCIQLYRTADVKIWNNVCIVDSGVLGDGMILGVESRVNHQDTMIVYNNYIYAGGHLLPGGDPNINAGYCKWYGYNEHPLSYWINNTIVTTNGGESPLVMEYMPYFKNNIIVQFGTNGQNPDIYGGTALETVTSTNSTWCPSCNPPCLVEQCNNNLMWREWGNISFVGQFSGNGNTGTPTGWSDWVNYGGTGVNANPLFVNNVRESTGYVISSNSPAINAGANLQAFIESKGLPWTDLEGRPRDSSPTLGAYEYGSTPVELTSFTATPEIGKILLNWETATETNNLGFDIERKSDYADWEKIGFVEGHGTTTEPNQYSYVDDISNVQSTFLLYRLKQIDFDGSFEYSEVVEVEVIPIKFDLSQNYPNPFNPTTTIRFSLPQSSQLKITVYNMIGQQVATLADGIYESGYHKITFNASNLPSGTYIYRMQGRNLSTGSAQSFTQVKKMILLK